MLPETEQRPPLLHGLVVHGVISQFAPLKPAGHAQEHVAGGPGSKTLTPPLLHISGSHGVTSQFVPEYPAGQVH